MIMRYITTIITPTIAIIVIISNWSFTKYNLKVQGKRGLISGLILTIAGLGYSTFQTLFIIKAIKKEIKKRSS